MGESVVLGIVGGGANENGGASGRERLAGRPDGLDPERWTSGASRGRTSRAGGSAFGGGAGAGAAGGGSSTFGSPLGGVGETTHCPRVLSRRPQS